MTAAFMLSRPELEARGTTPLIRLIDIAYADSGQSGRVRRFLLGIYNGTTFKFDLTDLRCLDREIQEDVLAVLSMDMDGPSVEVHNRIPGVSEVIAIWAQAAWEDLQNG